MQFDEVLKTFTEFFEREGMRYAIIGGLAMRAWGSERFTNDADFVIARDNRARAIEFAQSLGYETIYVSEGYSNHLHPNDDWGRVDLMYVDSGTAEKLFSSSVPRLLAGRVLPVAAPGHLASMKALAVKNAPRRATFEIADIAYLLSLPDVDRTAVREYFRRHGLLDLLDAIERQR